MPISYSSNLINLPTPSALNIQPSTYSSSNSNMGELIGSIGAAVSSVINGLFASQENKRNRKFQRETQAIQNQFTERMWNNQNDWNLAQWNRENEYNAPAAAMQRALDAGINPNSAAGIIAGTPQQAASIQADSVQGAGASGQGVVVPFLPGKDLIEGILGMTQKENIEADTDLKKAQAGKTEVETLLTKQQVKEAEQRWKDLLFKNEVLNPLQQEQMTKIIDNLVKEGKLTDKTVDKIDQEIQLFASQKAEIDERIKTYKEQIRLLQEQIKTEQSQQVLNALNAKLADMTSQLREAEKEGQVLYNNFEGKLQKVNMSTHQQGNTVLANEQTAALGVLDANENKNNSNSPSKDPEWNPRHSVHRNRRERNQQRYNHYRSADETYGR